MVVAAAVGAVGSVAGGVIAAGGAKSAANASAAAADRASEVQQQIYGENKQTLAPYVQTGLPATTNINALLGLGAPAPSAATTDWGQYVQGTSDALAQWQNDPRERAKWNNDINAFGKFHWTNDGSQRDLTPYQTFKTGLDATAAANAAFDQFRNSTGYNFRVNEGMRALNSGYAGAGTIKSGAAMRAASDYGQGMASQEFGNYLNALGNQQGVGLNAAGAQAGVATNYANSLGGIYQQNGENQANAALARANALGSGISDAASSIGGVMGYSKLFGV